MLLPCFRTTTMGDADHRRLQDVGMAGGHILERNRADPLAARLDDVLRAVGERDIAVRVDGRDVAGLEPALAVERAAAFDDANAGRLLPRICSNCRNDILALITGAARMFLLCSIHRRGIGVPADRLPFPSLPGERYRVIPK